MELEKLKVTDAYKNAIKLVKSTEASWFKNNAGASQFGYYLNFSTDGNQMEFNYNNPAPFSIKLDYQNNMFTKAYILNQLKEEMDQY